MAIGSDAPIGESFTNLLLPNGKIDWEKYLKWADWHRGQMEEHGLMYGYAKTMYVKGHVPSWRRKRK